MRAITRMMEQRDGSTLNYSSRPGSGIHNKSKTHCKYGHPLTGENLKIGRKGRVCIACRKRRAKAKNKRATPTDKKVQVVIDALKEGKTLRNIDGLYGHAYVTGTAPEGKICYLQAPAVTRFGRRLSQRGDGLGMASENLHNNRLMRRGKRHLYSITSSVRASSIGERSTPEVTQRIDGRTIDVDDDHLQVGWCGPTQPLVAGGMDHSVAGEPTEPCGSF